MQNLYIVLIRISINNQNYFLFSFHNKLSYFTFIRWKSKLRKLMIQKVLFIITGEENNQYDKQIIEQSKCISNINYFFISYLAS